MHKAISFQIILLTQYQRGVNRYFFKWYYKSWEKNTKILQGDVETHPCMETRASISGLTYFSLFLFKMSSTIFWILKLLVKKILLLSQSYFLNLLLYFFSYIGSLSGKLHFEICLVSNFLHELQKKRKSPFWKKYMQIRQLNAKF